MKNIAILIASGLFLVGCSGEKTTEPKAEASVTIDVDKDKNKFESALDKTGAELKKGAEQAKEKLEDAGHAIKKNVEAAKDKLTDDKKGEVKVEVNTK